MNKKKLVHYSYYCQTIKYYKTSFNAKEIIKQMNTFAHSYTQTHP